MVTKWKPVHKPQTAKPDFLDEIIVALVKDQHGKLNGRELELMELKTTKPTRTAWRGDPCLDRVEPAAKQQHIQPTEQILSDPEPTSSAQPHTRGAGYS